VGTPVVGDPGDHHRGAEAMTRGHGPGGEIAAIAGAGDPDARAVGEALRHAMIDAGEDVLELRPAGIADIEAGEILTPARIAAIVGQEDRIARRRIGRA